MISPSEKQSALLETYAAAVLQAPGTLNLTAAKDANEFCARHINDTLHLLATLPLNNFLEPLSVLDVGSGNGIPGIVIAISQPQWQVSLLDSNNKKCGFLDTFCKTNVIKNVRVLCGRAENLAHEEGLRETFDLVFARALSKLPVALELCIPFLKLGGLVIVPHGTSYPYELKASQKALDELGARLENTIPYFQNSASHFTALLFKKDRHTPERYPRRPGAPEKHPL